MKTTIRLMKPMMIENIIIKCYN
jgi:hypothetical protein